MPPRPAIWAPSPASCAAARSRADATERCMSHPSTGSMRCGCSTPTARRPRCAATAYAAWRASSTNAICAPRVSRCSRADAATPPAAPSGSPPRFRLTASTSRCARRATISGSPAEPDASWPRLSRRWSRRCVLRHSIWVIRTSWPRSNGSTCGSWSAWARPSRGSGRIFRAA